VRAIGAEHLENALAALAASVLAGAAPLEAARAIERAAPRPGRFEVHGSGPHVVIDFAHSPDALTRTLRTARQLCRGKLWLVFGAGGNRDRDKRPAMGQAARTADRVLLTSDNCRDEDPGEICAAIGAGLRGHPDVAEELDRERAIGRAITSAGESDVVLVAGRGPERELQLGSRRIPLVDADVAEAALRLR
jgi:UDP-N-acetylmuramoyl-L-alanyl-D-glutamate--2,6-diaminopimelate ligase